MDSESFRNRGLTSVYEPGSTFKVITVAAALEEGVFDEMDILFCNNGRFPVADVVINDHVPHGWLTLMGIIRKSSNIGASKVGLELGRERLGKYQRVSDSDRRRGSCSLEKERGSSGVRKIGPRWTWPISPSGKAWV